MYQQIAVTAVATAIGGFAVGAALIPDLSGDRNIMLGGLALGLTRKEVEEVHDPIVDFAELSEFIDLPMRT